MSDIECPYCEHGFDLDHDDGAYYDESTMEEAVCPECDKTFLVSASMHWYYESHKADCLNGADHAWSQWQKLWEGTKDEHPGQKLERRYCTGCDKSEQEWHKL